MSDHLQSETSNFGLLGTLIARWRKRAIRVSAGDGINRCADELEAAFAMLSQQDDNEGLLFRELSDILTGGNASTWEQVLDAARQKALLQALPQTQEPLILLRRMVEKLDVILPKADAIISLQTVRSGHQAYDGPNLVEEMKTAKALLAASTQAQAQEPEDDYLDSMRPCTCGADDPHSARYQHDHFVWCRESPYVSAPPLPPAQE